jgi:hypothetical protein
MARGDAVVDIVTVGASSYVEVQPPADEEWVIKMWGSGNWSGYALYIYDGSTRVWVGQSDLADSETPITLAINNGHYLSFHNTGGSAAGFFYSGYKTKDTS